MEYENVPLCVAVDVVLRRSRKRMRRKKGGDKFFVFSMLPVFRTLYMSAFELKGITRVNNSKKLKYLCVYLTDYIKSNCKYVYEI